MKNNRDKVIFRKWPKREGGTVIALFPAIAATVGNPYNCQSYEHVGQHGAASVNLTQRTKPATPAEYKDLAKELRQRGYRLRIVKRFTQADLAARKEQLK